MERDEEMTEPDSNIRFIVPDSQLSDDSSQDLEQLPALKTSFLCAEESSLPAAYPITSATTMSERKAKSLFNFSSTTESEVEEQGIILAGETTNDTSDSSRSESDKNVTVLEKVITQKQSDDQPIISTPAEKIRSLQFSGEHILVPETVDSYDEVEPTPDAFGSIPMIVPDSPCIDDKDEDEENEDSGEITFRPLCPTIDEEYQSTTQASTGRESQSIHLKLTPSQSDILDTSDAEEIATENVVTEKIPKMKSLLLHERPQLNTVSEGSKPLSSFRFQASKEVENPEESDDSLSVFRRVKSGSTIPQKHKIILDDSDEFLPGTRLTSLKGKSESISQSKRLPVTSPAKLSSLSKRQEKFIGQQDDISNTESNINVKEIVDVSSSLNTRLGGNITEDASSKHMDVDQTLSYDYTAIEKSLSISHDQSADVPTTPIENQANADIHIAQKHDDKADSPEGLEHHSEAGEQSAVSGKKTRTITILEQPLVQSIASSEGNRSKAKHSHSKTLQTSKSVASKRTLVNESPEQPDHSSCKGDRKDEHSSKVDASKDLNDNTSDVHKGGNDDPSAVDGRREEAAAVAINTNTSFSKVSVASYVSTLRQSKSADPYTFSGTPDQTVEGTSYLDLTEQSHVTAARDKKHIKIMKRVFKKRIPPKVEVDRSSTDDASIPDQNRNLESRDHNVRVRKQKLEKSVQTQTEENQQPPLVGPEQRQEEENQQQQLGATVSEPTQFTSLQKKPHFNKPFDPDINKAGPSTSHDDSRTHDTQQIHDGKHTKSEDSAKQHKKTTTSTEASTELSDSSEHEVETVTVQRIDTVICVTAEKTVTEVRSSKGELIRRTENTAEVERKVFDKVVSEKVTERIILPQLSPSRSVSTMTTGDLADISSSSLSRVYSSGSKSSNPSIEVAHYDQSLPTPAQRQQTVEEQDNRLQQEDEYRHDADLPGPSAAAMLMPVVQPKRHSASSSTGKDLFSTPNQSIIDHADSDVGKVVSSSNSTPCSHSFISPSTAIKKPDHEGRTKMITPIGTRSKGALTHDMSTSRFPTESDVNSPESAIVLDVPEQAGDNKGAAAVRGQNAPVEKIIYGLRHKETPGKQDTHKLRGKRTVRSDSHGDEQPAADSKSSKLVSKKRKISGAETSETTPRQQKPKTPGKTHAEIAREDMGELTDVQSTGFSVLGVPLSASSSSLKDPVLTVSSRSSAGFSYSPEISLQGGLRQAGANMVVLKEYRSKAVQGAKVMGKWKDGYYYPGILSKVDHSSKKYMIQFDDGSQRLVRPNEIILAAELPVGQSVMVLTSNDFYEPGMVMGHSEAPSEDGPAHFVYHVERDDGITQVCERKNLILSEGQAACLLSDEEMRISPDVYTPSTSKPGDISLDNLVEGKRHLKTKSVKAVSEKEDQPSVSGAQLTSAAAPASAIEGENCQSGRKRKEGPVATSTPTAKQICKEGKKKGTPMKNPVPHSLGGAVASPHDSKKVQKARTGTPVKNPVPHSLGGAVASPHDSKKVQQKARAGLLFETSMKKSNLFEGMTFVLTHVEKSAEDRRQEKLLLEDSSLETSTDNNTDVECDTSPFVKEHLRLIIENGGGQVIHSISDAVSGKNCYLVAAEYQRTVKYLQALAAGMTIVSHQWILHSVDENRLQGLKAYILPAGISLEKRKLVERTRGCSDLANQTVMVVSSNKEFTEAWTSILKMAQSHIVTRFPTRASKNDPGVDVVVSDSSCPSTVVRRCQQLDVPLVSSEWVAQCLITGHLVDVKGHEKYKHDFSS